jgi:hypothetical protein
MGTIRDLLEALERVDLEAQAEVILENTSEEIIKHNQSQLYYEGIDADGKSLEPYKWKEYAAYKARRNPSHPGIPDLYDEGNFYRGFEVELLGGAKFTLKSTDEKATALEQKYGQIFGLTDENEAKYGEFYKALLMAYISNVTGLKSE